MKTVLFGACASAALVALTWSASQGVAQPPVSGQAEAGGHVLVASPDYKPPLKRISPFANYANVMKSSLPTPRAADGKPDLAGMWGNVPSPAGGGGLRKDGVFEPDQVALHRSSVWEKPLYKPEFWQQVRDLDFSEVDVDTTYNCYPPGIPRMNAPVQIIQTPTKIVLVYGGLRTRIVPVNGRTHTPEDFDLESFDGVPIGKWEDDKLVVESVGFTDQSWLQWMGYFHSNRMKVTERIWRQGDLLFYNFTVDDPDTLMEPWTQGTLVRRLIDAPGARLEEAPPCEKFEPEGDVYLRG